MEILDSYSASTQGLIKGWRLSATIQLRSPLRVLESHGRIHLLEDGSPPQPPQHEGAWAVELKSNAELGINLPELQIGPQTTASDIGQIPRDGGEYLRFLRAVRTIVERRDSVEMRLQALRAELLQSKWLEFVERLGGPSVIEGTFFPAFVYSIQGVSRRALEVLKAMDLSTPAAITAASDKTLLAIDSIGPAKLKLIRQACEEAAEKDAELLDCVNR